MQVELHLAHLMKRLLKNTKLLIVAIVVNCVMITSKTTILLTKLVLVSAVLAQTKTGKHYKVRLTRKILRASSKEMEEGWTWAKLLKMMKVTRDGKMINILR